MRKQGKDKRSIRNMATGTKRAQELLGDTKCDLCDTYKNVSWKCQTCDDILCAQCKRSHLRSRISKNHIVTELEDSKDDNQGSSIFCPDHEDEAFQMFCTTCHTLVCLNCISGKHKGHECKLIKEVANSIQTQLEDIFKQIKTQQIPKLEQYIVSITKLQGNYSQELDQAVTDIRSRGEGLNLKKEITKIQDRLMDELMQQATKDEKCITDTKEQIELGLSALKEQLKDHEEKMKKFTDIDIIAEAASIKTSLSQLSGSPDMPELKPSKFETGKMNNRSLENMFGQLLPQQPGEIQTERPKFRRNQMNQPDEMVTQDRSKSQDTRAIKGNIVSSIRWREGIVKTEMSNQNESWLMSHTDSYQNQYLELVNDQGNRITSIKHDFYIWDMAVTIYGDLLVTEGNEINRLTKSGKKDAFTDLSPYSTHGIHVTQNEDVLVGLYDLDKNKSRVTRLSSTGQTLQVIDNIKKDVNMGIPHRITENVNHDIVMICAWSYILVVDKDGRYRFTYTGPPTTIKMTWMFNPTDTICNHSGQILVADKSNSTIHLLDKDGTFIEFILTKQHGIEEPRALAIDHSGKIWVGCNNGKIFIAE